MSPTVILRAETTATSPRRILKKQQFAQSPLSTANTPHEVESLSLSNTRKRRHILCEDNVGSSRSFKPRRSISLPPSQEPFPALHGFTASDTSIEAWLQQTEAVKAQSRSERVHKRKRTTSPTANCQVSSSPKRLKELETPYKTFSDPQPSTTLPASFDSHPSIEHRLKKTLSSTSTFTSSTSTQTLAVTPVTSDKSQRSASQTQNKRKRSPSPPASRKTGPPLTEKVLRKYLKGMDPANKGLTTPQGNEDHQVMNLDASTPSKSSSTSNTPSATDIKFYMEQLGMFLIQGKLNEPSFSDFKAKVMAVIDANRGSAMKPSSVQKKRSTTQEDPNNSGETITTVEDYEDSGLSVVLNREFRRNCLPNAFTAMGYEDKISRGLIKKQGVKNPKADRVYGLVVEKYPVPRGMKICPATHELLEIVYTIIHGFFIIEGKSSNGSMTKAALQALRGTTALIYSQRTVLISTKQLAADGGDLGPDDQTFVYSCTIDDAVMNFFVTFACVEKDNNDQKVTSYYMERLATEAYLSGNNAPAIMRKICHNILDWGVGTRHAMLEKRCAAIYAFDDAWLKQDAAKKRETHCEKQGSPSKRQKKGNMGSSGIASPTGEAPGAQA